MATIDFTHRTCPNCGAQGFPIRSRESLSGTCGLNILGPKELDWDGYTDVDWNNQRTEFFYCADCETRLPDEWQEAISQALDGNIESLVEE